MLTSPTAAGSFLMLYFDDERSSMVKVNLHLFGGMAGKHAFCLKASFTKGFEISCQFLVFLPLYGVQGRLAFQLAGAQSQR